MKSLDCYRCKHAACSPLEVPCVNCGQFINFEPAEMRTCMTCKYELVVGDRCTDCYYSRKEENRYPLWVSKESPMFAPTDDGIKPFHDD